MDSRESTRPYGPHPLSLRELVESRNVSWLAPWVMGGHGPSRGKVARLIFEVLRDPFPWDEGLAWLLRRVRGKESLVSRWYDRTVLPGLPLAHRALLDSQDPDVVAFFALRMDRYADVLYLVQNRRYSVWADPWRGGRRPAPVSLAARDLRRCWASAPKDARPLAIEDRLRALSAIQPPTPSDWTSVLCAACALHDATTVHWLLEQGASAHTPDRNGHYPVGHALRQAELFRPNALALGLEKWKGLLETVHALSRAGVNLESRTYGDVRMLAPNQGTVRTSLDSLDKNHKKDGRALVERLSFLLSVPVGPPPPSRPRM